MYDCIERRVILGDEIQCKREVASLTKMMTLLTVIKLMQRFSMLNPAKVLIKVSRAAAKVTGTSGNL